MSDPAPGGRASRGGRTRYLINPTFQLRFVGLMIGIAGMAAFALYLSNALFMAKIVGIGNSLGLPADHPFWRFINEQKLVLNSVFLLTAAGVSILIVVLGLIISHRIAGPIYRMQSHLDDLARTGEVKELNFREKDYFPEMADSINRVMRRFSAPKSK